MSDLSFEEEKITSLILEIKSKVLEQLRIDQVDDIFYFSHHNLSFNEEDYDINLIDIIYHDDDDIFIASIKNSSFTKEIEELYHQLDQLFETEDAEFIFPSLLREGFDSIIFFPQFFTSQQILSLSEEKKSKLIDHFVTFFQSIQNK